MNTVAEYADRSTFPNILPYRLRNC